MHLKRKKENKKQKTIEVANDFCCFLIVSLQYYTSPVSGYTFSTDMEALDYLFSEMDERILESEACAEDNELHVSEAFSMSCVDYI